MAFDIPKTSKAAVLVQPGKFEIREFPIPPIGDDEMLVKVEGCGVCGTDGHEYKRDPFGLCPVVLGHEGSGIIVKKGSSITVDSAGIPVKEGDRIVTCVIPCGSCSACLNTPDRTNLCEHCGVYGLYPDDDTHLNGYYAEYLKIRPNSTFFNVNGLSLDQRMLIEPAAVAVHAVERAKTTGLLNFNTKVVVQGCGPIGLMVMAVIRTLGIDNIIAVDGNDNRLALAKEMGASKTFNFTKYADFQSMLKEIQEATDGLGAGFAFQCTGVPAAAANVWKMVRRGGGLCEVGFFLPMGTCTIDPHYDICNKEITAVGSWVYSPQDYPIAFAFLRRAAGIGLPMEKLVTHHFPLEKIGEALETNVQMKGIKVAVVVE
ncbi:MAG: zinc-binding dehydrogenase [Victivallaceae bacterium]|nr:zinc-binding dehydrogenase [Victivallaceae bacterium]